MTFEPLKRAARSLRALSVGDAFGERFFGPPAQVLERIVAQRLPDPPWRYTDDTVMALSIFDVLAEYGAIEPDVLAHYFARRYLDDPMRGYGGGAHRILADIARGVPWRNAASALFDGTGSYGNGGAMRVAPLGAHFADAPERAARQAAASAEVTHAHVEGIAGAIATAVAAAVVTAGDTIEHDAVFDAVVALTPPSDTRDAILRARALDVTASVNEAAAELGTGSRVAAFDTVPFCLWVVGRAPATFEEAMWLTVAGLGDRDTTCAIVAGIIGGRLAPPTAWLDATEALTGRAASLS